MGGILSLYNEEARPGESNRESSGRGADARPLQTAPTCSGDEAEEPGQGGGPGTTLDDLPEACLARILAHVDRPRDVARLALVSRSFGDAVRSDTVWEKLLPRNYAQVLAEAADAQGPVSFSSKKEIYDFLCRNVVFLEGGKKAFWLDAPTGATCFMVSARALYIVWGDDPRYWEWVSDPESRFKEVARLKEVCWLEARGRIACQLTPGRYSLSWRIRMAERRPFQTHLPYHGWLRSNIAQAWTHKPVNFSLFTSDGQTASSARYLDGQLIPTERQLALSNLATAVRRDGNWVDYVTGEFVVDKEGYVDLEFSMMEIEGGTWKEGLILEGIVILPCEKL